MSNAADRPYRGTLPRRSDDLAQWHAGSGKGVALEPAFPIVDAHHHLFGAVSDRLHYTVDELVQDLSSGHRIVGTVYCEAYECGWRSEGLESMRPVGEVERIVDLLPRPIRVTHGACTVAAGIVAHCDMLSSAGSELIEAELAASAGRLRGVRHRTATDDGLVGQFIPQRPANGLMTHSTFKQSVRRLPARALSFDAWIYHHQLGELIELADACPDTQIILNHVGGVIGVAEYRSRGEQVRAQWLSDMRALALRQNVVVKVGGLGMAVFGFGFEAEDKPAVADDLHVAWRPFIHACLETFGSSRCMFESNFPVDKQSCSYVELWNALKLATIDLSTAERCDLFYRTACRTYRLPDIEAQADRIIFEEWIR